jgi:transposase-like protein
MANDTYSGEGPQCPFCKRQYVADADGWWYDKNNFADGYKCDECGNTFDVEVEINITWSCTRQEARDAKA